MKIIFFHGLESRANSLKVDWLREQQHEVVSEQMDYLDPRQFEVSLGLVKSFSPDLLVGSSMGGYFALAISTLTGIRLVAFNPALHSRSFEPIVRWGDIPPKGTFFLSSEDNVIDPAFTHRLVSNSMFYSDVRVEVTGGGHQIELNTWKVCLAPILK